MAKPTYATNSKVLTRLDRARIIRDAVIDHDHRHGSWQPLDLPGGRETRVRTIDPGRGWSAIITSRFSGGPVNTVTSGSSNGQVVMDVYLTFGPKVLSIATSISEDMLISMAPGSWESEMFGLPHQGCRAKRERRSAQPAAAKAMVPDDGKSPSKTRARRVRRDHPTELIW
ncbi:hypothetical protein E5673_14230 [Sphingomonas sp. PAMC26645]|uniref:hypothetical protein n=1 Tax=Sphingomonas sp. PAMC26645 TaxID=2565555 RepID=UPI00109D945D|nr:hypothetical protein [Sphingomonas sp. PAMC26645]QCB43238.1 hypothetical protein E5673_14230 [Sphingomonas sp. PAMC26645]